MMCKENPVKERRREEIGSLCDHAAAGEARGLYGAGLQRGTVWTDPWQMGQLINFAGLLDGERPKDAPTFGSRVMWWVVAGLV